MSLIDSRFECDECGGYRLPFASTLSSRCKCPDYAPVEPERHQIGSPVTRGRSKHLRDAAR
jgi:uncharacterized Zn finger protein